MSKLVIAQQLKELISACDIPQLFNYLVILKANENHYAVQERFEK